MVRENMRSPRAVLHSSIFCEFLLQGGSLCWVRLPGSHQVLRDITALFFRLLLKKTVLSQSEGPDDFYPPSASGGPLIGLVGKYFRVGWNVRVDLVVMHIVLSVVS